MKLLMPRTKMLLMGVLLVLSTSAGMATGEEICCYPESIIYYDEADNVVGLRMRGCGDPGWGVTTNRSKRLPNCVR